MKDVSKMNRKEYQEYMIAVGKQRQAEQEQKKHEEYLLARAQQGKAEQRESKRHTRPVARVAKDGKTIYREEL